MRTWLLVVLLACGGGNKPAPRSPPPVTKTDPPATPPATPVPTPPPAQQDFNACTDVPCLVAAMDAFSQKMCACKDQSCADAVNGELTTWATKLSEKPELNNTKPTDDETKQITDVMQRYQTCMTKIMSAKDTGLGAGAP